MKIRKEIMEFAEVMEKVMRVNDKKKGDSWKTLSLGYLEDKMGEQWDEWFPNPSKAKTVDVANYCMMLFHRYDEIHK